MQRSICWVAGAIVLITASATWPLNAQGQQGQRGQTPPVQVGVPEGGRQGAGPANGGGGRGRRGGGGPPRPAPRSADGKILLG
jgi:hypothetical protein